MTIATKPIAIHDILLLARDLSADDRHWLAEMLNYDSDASLPESATLDEAIAWYVLDLCSLGRAAELAGVTRWDVIDRLKTLGISIPIENDKTAEEMDEFAELLEREGFL